jgi:hypothetical protein
VGTFADQLLDELEQSREWPLRREWEARDRVDLARAFRETDRDYLLNRHPQWDVSRRYLADPLARDISDAYATLLFGRPPTITAATEADQTRWDEWVRDNDLHATLLSEEAVCSSEGEVWWRLNANATLGQVMLTWYSRNSVVPFWVSGRHLRALAFAERLDPLVDDNWVYRHFEIHDTTTVLNVLFAGSEATLGTLVSLETHPDTEHLEDEWQHDLGEMLGGRIINRPGSDPRVPMGDYHHIQDQLWALNEAMTIGAENAKLTLKKRVIVDESMVDATGNIPAGKEALVVESDAEISEGKDAGGRFKVLEYGFDANELAMYRRDLAETACTRAGISLVFVGADSEQGRADTGTALRVRLLPTLNAGELRAGAWDTHFPTPLGLVPRLAALPEDDGGLGQQWATLEPPTFTRGPSLHEDPVERQDRVARGRESRTVSTWQAVRDLHPTWTDEEIDVEVDRIREDDKQASPIARVLGNGVAT